MEPRNYRTYSKNQYINDKEAINARQVQPRRGNYRIDANGNPIVQSVDADSTSETTNNYARNEGNWEEKQDTISNILKPKNFRIEEYSNQKETWNHRSNQPYSEFNSYNRKYDRMGNNQPVNQSKNIKIVPNRKKHNLSSKLKNNRGMLLNHLPDNRLQLLMVFSIIFLIFIVNGSSLLPNNWVNRITVTGNHYIDEGTIISSSRIESLDQLDTVMQQKVEIEKKIQDEIPIIESVNFIRKDWKGLEIHVTEYDIVAIKEEQGVMMPVMSNGEILVVPIKTKGHEQLTDLLPLLVGFEQKGKISELTNNALRTIDDNLLSKMKTITLSDNPAKPNTVIVKMKDGNEVHAVINTFSQKMAYYDAMVEQIDGRKGIIDLEVGAYFTPYTNINSGNNENNLDNNQN